MFFMPGLTIILENHDPLLGFPIKIKTALCTVK